MPDRALQRDNTVAVLLRPTPYNRRAAHLDHDMLLTPTVHARRPVALAALGCAVVLAACGSSSKPGTAAANDHALGVKFATCIRSHGVPSFPDPEPNSGIQIPISFEQQPSPAFTSAQKTCQYLVPRGGGPPVASSSQKAAALKFAQCVREHHVPNYPDPTYKNGHLVIPPPPLTLSQFNQLIASPAFTTASKACQSS